MNPLAQPCVGLVYDLRSEYLALGYREEQVAEFDSDITVESLEATIRSLGYPVQRIGNAFSLCKRLAAGDRWDVVFTIAEGLSGRCRESQVPCLLELYDIPYTFSDPLVCAVTLDKAVAKRLVRDAGLNTPDFCVVSTPEDLKSVSLRYPLFAKPIAEGTGKGVDARSRAASFEDLSAVCQELLARLKEPVLVEEFLPGREFTVAILGTGERARVLGTMEVTVISDREKNIYSYQVKEECEIHVQYSRVSDVPVRQAVEDLALKTFRVLECRDAGRVDIRLDAAGEPAFMEINPIPGLHPNHSDLPMIATQEGMAYSELIQGILQSALSRREKIGVS